MQVHCVSSKQSGNFLISQLFSLKLYLSYFTVENISGMRTEAEINVFLFHFSFSLSSQPCPRSGLLFQCPCVHACFLMNADTALPPSLLGNSNNLVLLLLGLPSGICVLCQTLHGRIFFFKWIYVPNHDASIHQNLRIPHPLDQILNVSCQKHA